MRDKLEHDSSYRAVTTDDDRTTINEKLTEVDSWLGDDGYDADVKVTLLGEFLFQFTFDFL